MTKRVVAGPRVAGGHISAMVPPPILKGGLPNTPAKKRQTKTAPILFETAAPMENSTAIGIPSLKTINRPNVSLSGAPIVGPRASPKQKSETPSKETVSETPNSAAVRLAPGA